MFSGGAFVDQLAAAAVAQSPTFAVLLCGIFLAVLRRRRHPTASVLLTVGLTLILIDYAASYADAYSWAVNLALGPSPSNLVVASFASGAVAAVAFGLIIAAVFAGRVQHYGELPLEARRHD